jgi:hypothetical protein
MGCRLMHPVHFSLSKFVDKNYQNKEIHIVDEKDLHLNKIIEKLNHQIHFHMEINDLNLFFQLKKQNIIK